MRHAASLFLTLLFACLLLAAPARAQTYVDTFGDTSNNTSTSSSRLKVNVYMPTVDCTLQTFEVYAGGTTTASVALYQMNGTTGTRIWNGTVSLSSTALAWRSVAVNQPLLAGVQYAIGIYINGSTVYYAYGSSASFAGSGWGNETNWADFIAGTTLPTSFSTSSVQSAGGYRQRLTIFVDGDADADGWTSGNGDCDDSDPGIYPGATELCDGLDGNCDGVLPANETDGDGDTWIPCTGDCNDSNALTYPSAPEQCDGADNDCDGATDEGISPDLDGDGYSALGSCLGSADDCDDNNPAIRPGATEACDGSDNDCNGSIDEGLSPDEDGDGATAVGACLGTANDCDDNNDFTYPGATEICDGQDNDCSGAPSGNETDDDDDGVLACGGDCDDGDDSIYPGAPEDCSNGEDDNCNGQIDEDIDADGDGSSSCEDCNDSDADVNPEADEDACDGVDTDCDGDLHSDEADADGDGVTLCDDDCDDEDADSFPGAEEVCDGADNDCDGVVPDDEADCAGDDDDGGDDDDDGGGGGGGGGGGRRGGCSVEGHGSAPASLLAIFGAAALLRPRRRR